MAHIKLRKEATQNESEIKSISQRDKAGAAQSQRPPAGGIPLRLHPGDGLRGEAAFRVQDRHIREHEQRDVRPGLCGEGL